MNCLDLDAPWLPGPPHTPLGPSGSSHLHFFTPFPACTLGNPDLMMNLGLINPSQCTPTCNLGQDLRPLYTPLARQHNTGLDHEVGLTPGPNSNPKAKTKKNTILKPITYLWLLWFVSSYSNWFCSRPSWFSHTFLRDFFLPTSKCNIISKYDMNLSVWGKQLFG